MLAKIYWPTVKKSRESDLIVYMYISYKHVHVFPKNNRWANHLLTFKLESCLYGRAVEDVD